MAISCMAIFIEIEMKSVIRFNLNGFETDIELKRTA